MNLFNAKVLEEPTLLFGGSFPAPDPKIGLSLYGPYSNTFNSIGIGIIGDKDTIDQTKQILERYKRPVKGPDKHPLWTQDFPGMSFQSPFKCELIIDPKWEQSILPEEIDKIRLEKIPRLEDRISQAVAIFEKYIRNLKNLEQSPKVVICAPPKRLMDLCISSEERYRRGFQSKVLPPKKTKSVGRAIRISGDAEQLSLFEIPEFKELQNQIIQWKTGENFHNFLKAKVMDLGMPTQLILPYTLDIYTGRERKRLQDEATFAWNLCVALYYKADLRLWSPANIPSGTCFVGISFYREKKVFGGRVGTSLAQVFTPEGEGLVIRGERFDWAKGRSPNISASAAKRLLEKGINLYYQHVAQMPARVVIHKTSKYSEEEEKGFKEALSSNGINKYDFLAIEVRARRLKFFRQGYNPVLRNTMISLPDRSTLLYTKAYIPFMKVYPGPRVPRPLEILQHIGVSSIETVCREILALTKMNWNSADFTSLFPITIQFSKQVGNILKELPPGVTPQGKYSYYM